jgi:hypothetical protein
MQSGCEEAPMEKLAIPAVTERAHFTRLAAFTSS